MSSPSERSPPAQEACSQKGAARGGSEFEKPRSKPRLRLKAVETHPTAWDPSSVQPTLNVVVDAAIVEAPPPTGARISYSHVAVLDNFIGEPERTGLLDAITAPGWDHTHGPPEDKWERKTCDGAGLPPTWGLKASIIDGMASAGLPAVLEVQSRLCLLYPEYDIIHLPSSAMQSGTGGSTLPPEEDTSTHVIPTANTAATSPRAADKGYDDESDGVFDCCPMLANAAVAGDAFQWHVDADPAALPQSVWTDTFGDYCNGEPGKPLLVSLVVYLNENWPRDHDAETLFLDSSDEIGVVVRPKRYRVVLMDQDVLHRLSPPSQAAGGHPRYSLVWKLGFLPKKPGAQCSIARREWGQPTPLGSAARLERLKRKAVSEGFDAKQEKGPLAAKINPQ